MDHFLFAKNPLKKTASTGLQGYIIDTVKGTWIRVELFVQPGKPDKHELTMIAGTGDNKEDRQSAMRGSRWYNSILIARKIKEADIVVTLPKYTGNEPEPEKRVEYVVEENSNIEIPNSSFIKGTNVEESLTPVRQLNAAIHSK